MTAEENKEEEFRRAFLQSLPFLTRLKTRYYISWIGDAGKGVMKIKNGTKYMHVTIIATQKKARISYQYLTCTALEERERITKLLTNGPAKQR